MLSIGSLGSQTSSITTLINQLMTLERQPLQALQAKKTEIGVTSAMFSDLKAKLNNLRSLAEDLTATGSLSIFNTKTVTSSNADAVTATASGEAVNSSYSVEVASLARAFRVQSDRQASSSESTGLVGTIRVQDAIIQITAENNSLLGIRDAINGATYAAGRGVVASVIDNRLLIQSQVPGAANTVALADLSGNVLSGLGVVTGASTNLATGCATSASSSAVGYEASKVNDGAHGDANAWMSATPGSGYVQIDLGSARTINRLVWGRGEASDPNDRVPKDYTIQVSTDGATWTTVKTVTGHSFASAGDNATDAFASVSARYVRIDVTATTDGLEPVIDEIEVYDDTNMYGLNLLQAGADASFTVDGVSVTRSSNSGLTDVVAGLTINLKATTTSAVSLTVESDTTKMTDKINSFLTALNDVTSYLRTKSAVTKVGDTYVRGGLCGYYTFTSLRTELYAAMAGEVSGVTGAYRYLSEIGITMNSDMQFVVSDSTALSNALTGDTASVSQLFSLASGGIANKLVALLTPYTEANGYVDDEMTGLSEETSELDERITRLEAQLAQREQQLRSQFLALQAMLSEIMAQQSALQSLAYNSYNGASFSL